MGSLGAWLARRVRDPLLAELRQGATPEGLAASVATGTVFAVTPIIGTTTALCFLAGKVGRLNHVALQTVNFFLYPLQIALIVPFVRIGEWLARAEPMPLSPMQLAAEFSAGPLAFLTKFAAAGAHALLGWVLVAPACGWLLCRALRPVFRRLADLTAKA